MIALCHNPFMEKGLFWRLREIVPELNAAGIVHPHLHGSVARGQETPSSMRTGVSACWIW
jgi:hypothetical protein